MPAACQNGAETRDTELQPDNEQTWSDQEGSRLTRCVKRPSQQLVTAQHLRYLAKQLQ